MQTIVLLHDDPLSESDPKAVKGMKNKNKKQLVF